MIQNRQGWSGLSCQSVDPLYPFAPKADLRLDSLWDGRRAQLVTHELSSPALGSYASKGPGEGDSNPDLLKRWPAT